MAEEKPQKNLPVLILLIIAVLIIAAVFVIPKKSADKSKEDIPKVGMPIDIKQEVASDVTEKIEIIKLKAGDMAPEFSLLDQDGNDIALSNFEERKILLYFYPKADSPVCTAQACGMRDAARPLRMARIVTLGISPDKPEVLKKFDEKHSLGFHLLSDPDYKTAQAYGVLSEDSEDGKKIIRSSFLIDEQRKILEVWYDVDPNYTAPMALDFLDE
jgi:peroxiredoxin Q/BCP